MNGARGAGIGSMPGTDYARALDVVLRTTPDLVAMPELPARGPHAGMTGRSYAVGSGLSVDFGRGGWQLSRREGASQRRALETLIEDLDIFEAGFAAVPSRAVKMQVAGPWTLAATTLRRRSTLALGDRRARLDITQGLAKGIGEVVRELRRRTSASEVYIQVDEPALPAVLGGGVPKPGIGRRYAAIDRAEVSEALRASVDAIVENGGIPVVHCCGRQVPVRILMHAGFDAISFDLDKVTRIDGWTQAIQDGIELWLGVVPPLDSRIQEPRSTGMVQRFHHNLGYSSADLSDRIVVTPACGLAGASPEHAVRALEASQRIAKSCGWPMARSHRAAV